MVSGLACRASINFEIEITVNDSCLSHCLLQAIEGSSQVLTGRMLLEARAKYSLHQMQSDVWVAAAKLAALERFAAVVDSGRDWIMRGISESQASAVVYGMPPAAAFLFSKSNYSILG